MALDASETAFRRCEAALTAELEKHMASIDARFKYISNHLVQQQETLRKEREEFEGKKWIHKLQIGLLKARIEVLKFNHAAKVAELETVTAKKAKA